MMNIVQPTAADIGIKDATQLTGYSSEKTLRRAVQTGALPRRYVQTARGPALVFRHAEVEHWLAERKRPRQRRAAAPTVEYAALLDTSRQMSVALSTSQAAMAAMVRQIEKHEQQLAMARTAIDLLTTHLISAEAVAGKDAPDATVDEAAMTVMVSGRRLA